MHNLSPKSYRLPLQNKLVGLSAMIIIGIVAFVLFFYHSFSTSLEEEKKAQSKNFIESALGIIQHFHQLELSAKLSTSDAQQMAMRTLESATYGDDGYFWINDNKGKILIQPYMPNLVGLNMTNWADSNGKYIFQEFDREARNGGGWVSYTWPKLNTAEEFPKISYVAHYAAWDWLIGTGLYLDDMKSNIFWAVLRTSGVLLFGFLIFIFTIIVIINYFVHQLSELSVRDALTNLYTKRFLKEISPALLNHSKVTDYHLTAIFIDLDHFKLVNDIHGHDHGDKVLKQVATVMRHNAKQSDYCMRYGGEEFVLIGFFKNEISAVNMAEMIRHQVSEICFINDDNEFSVTLSAGIALHNSQSEESFENTLKRADVKLYEAKTAGRNRVVI
ncbi:diguanylate cyclase [Moritella sp. Urea-trap-13]|uniref:cache domain-containing protein n=1 Tax=Moritella sp. Urea-trap-13 TaxID=2058327 RepID=UPI001E4D9530|nr:diguanylate cyclase [Moritella sp. Urea-trap-13]